MCRVMVGEEAANKIKSIPLSNDTVSRRIKDISFDVKSQLTDVVSLLFLTDHTLSSVSLLTSLYSSSSNYLTHFTTRAPSGAVSHYMYYSKQLL